MHKFNNYIIRTPTDFSWDLEDILVGEDMTTADGKDNSAILTQKRVISYSWGDPTPAEVSYILGLTNQSRYVAIYYPDAINGYETREFMCIKKSAPSRQYRVGALLYSSLTLSFRER